MACVDCEKRRKALRDAIFQGKLAEAADITVEGLRVMIGVDAGADHRREALEAPVADVIDPAAVPAPEKRAK